MRKKIDWRDRAKADLRSIDRLNAMDILRSLDHFSKTGKGDIKRLTMLSHLRLGYELETTESAFTISEIR